MLDDTLANFLLTYNNSLYFVMFQLRFKYLWIDLVKYLTGFNHLLLELLNLNHCLCLCGISLQVILTNNSKIWRI